MGVIESAIRYKSCKQFGKVIIVLDDDGDGDNKMEEARKMAGREKIELIVNTPCLEKMLLSIVGDTNRVSNKRNSQEYKKIFERYIEKRKRKDVRKYTIFTKELLDKKRKEDRGLDRILQILEEGRNETI